ncbi:MAG: amidohydrolase [Tissierellia bacterium]|jgi:amidohydrolase|nr:M20 family metallopeptidase [Bacillota bacterium]NLK58364.1 amidohydrolase [Tissierellia bacterium]
MSVKALAAKYKDEMIALRRWFHQHPELSLKEYNTSKRIKEELDKLDIPYETIGETGVLGTIKGGKEGKTILLRSDMDALEVTEKNDFEFKSVNDGVMHACGHDAHTAILIGAAKILKELQEEIPGTVKLCFQPAEELAQGAKMMIEEGHVLDGVDGAFGGHVWADVPVGQVDVTEGPRMASADMFVIRITGKSGHGSMPDQALDTVVCGSDIVMALQTIASREISPLEPIAITVGTFNAGTRFNIIAGEAELTGTTRCFNPDIWAVIDKEIERVAVKIGEAHRCKVEVEYHKMTPPTINDNELAKLARESVVKVMGEEGVTRIEKTTGAEDFAFFANAVPSVFAFIGCANPDKFEVMPHHHECFQIDEDCMEYGAAVYAQYALDFLNQ